jgi:TorA maturation chaperone TorD
MNNFELHEIDLALCRSAIYEALALGFRPPTRATIERLVFEYQNRALAEIAAMLQPNSPNGKLESLAARVRQLSFCADARDLESLQISYRRLFGHTAHPQAPPYETEYGDEALFQQPQELGDIAGFYGAFGLKVNTFERVDHISCECEFFCFLNRKEAYALEENNEGMLQETRKAERLFLNDHFGRFVPAFTKLLHREAPESFYAALGNLCHDFARMECARFKVPLGSELLRLRPTELADEGFNCGSGDELIQITKRASASTVTL